jgi:hypothetical protein
MAEKNPVSIDHVLNYLADQSSKRIYVKSMDTNIGVISANGGTKWVTLNKPANALCVVGYYVYNTGNTKVNLYAISTSSIAACNLGSSATGSNLKITVYWLCYGEYK